MLTQDTFKQSTQLVVIQPTAFCNIDCRYCYLPQRSSTKNSMSLPTLTRILESIFSSTLLADNLTIAWHAGEPLTIPLDFYYQAAQLIERFNTRGIQVKMALQTNGILLTQAWCDFIKQQQISVSVSLDGPQHIHDHERVTRAGKGTFEQTMQGVRLLQKNGIQPAIIFVLTSYALDYPDEIWQFFQDNHLYQLAFNVEEINGAHTQSSLATNRDGTRYKKFLRRFLSLRAGSSKHVTIREIDSLMQDILRNQKVFPAQESTPSVVLSFDYQGNVSTFASELLTMTHPLYGNLWLGNVFEHQLDDLFRQQKFININTEIQQGVTSCRESCTYYSFCGGGSPVNKLSEHGTFDTTETAQCYFRIQVTTDVIMDHLERRSTEQPDA